MPPTPLALALPAPAPGRPAAAPGTPASPASPADPAAADAFAGLVAALLAAAQDPCHRQPAAVSSGTGEVAVTPVSPMTASPTGPSLPMTRSAGADDTGAGPPPGAPGPAATAVRHQPAKTGTAADHAAAETTTETTTEAASEAASEAATAANLVALRTVAPDPGHRQPSALSSEAGEVAVTPTTRTLPGPTGPELPMTGASGADDPGSVPPSVPPGSAARAVAQAFPHGAGVPAHGGPGEAARSVAQLQPDEGPVQPREPAPGQARAAEATPGRAREAEVAPAQAVAGPAPAASAAPAAAPAAAAPAGAPAAPPPGTPAGTAHQIAPAVFAVHQRGVEGTHRITVEVAPESLGPVRLEVTLRDGEVQVTLAGSSDASRDALRAALPDLRRAVEEAGVTAGQIDVSPERFTGGQERGGAERFAFAQARHVSPAEPERPAEPAPGAGARPAAGALDLHL